jgi:predicted transcriptional regulator
MKFAIPGARALVPFGIMALFAGIFTYSVKADSTLSIPMPQDIKDKQVTISLRIPPNTEPLNRDQAKPTMASKRSMIVWNSNPSPKISDNDEVHNVFQTYLKKGWVKTQTARGITRMRPMDKFYAVRLLQHITENVIEIGMAPNFGQIVRKCNLTTSDIEDLRRMIKRFEKDLVTFGTNTKKVDKDLLMLQERFKKSRQGILKVLRVEGGDDGGTVIHLSVD